MTKILRNIYEILQIKIPRESLFLSLLSLSLVLYVLLHAYLQLAPFPLKTDKQLYDISIWWIKYVAQNYMQQLDQHQEIPMK